MTKWTPQDLSPRGPVYLAVADALARDIEAGRLAPGDRLPTHRDLARTLGVNVVTVTRSYAEAARRGLVEGEVGRGTFVRQQSTTDNAFLPLDPDEAPAIDLHFNMPVGTGLQAELRELFGEFAKAPERTPFENGYFALGLSEHRSAGAEWISRTGLAADPARTVVCSGAQHAMTVAFADLTQPGDLILAEELTYSGLKSLANVLHLRTHPVAMDRDGLLPDAFEEACRKSQPKALYTMPTVQNPTGRVMPEARRREIAEVARRYGVPIVEDDTTGFLCGDAPAPIGVHAPELTTFVTSLSKSVSHGLRIGYLLAPTERSEASGNVERMAAIVAGISWMTPPLMAEIATRWIRDGTAERIAQAKREESVARRRLFPTQLRDLVADSHATSSFVWLPLPSPWRGEDFVAQARRRGVAVSPAEAFAVGRTSAPHAVRVSHGTPASRQDAERGLRVLSDVLQRNPQPCRPCV